jgi:prepilin-type N-terminal cleavage/methylation domain-containing protein
MGRARKRAAFTLVELLVVIGIIAILAGMLMPAIMAARTKAHESSTLNLIHQCEVAATGFFNDYGDYPPSTWEEYFALVEYDYDGNGTFEGAEEGDPDFPDFDATTAPGWLGGDPRDSNEGIEVFVAAVATRTGGPYMEPGGDQLGNTDGDEDGDPDDDGDYETASASNWFFGGEPSPLFELVDFWGNPLVYFHNRDYARYDGAYLSGTDTVFDEPNDGVPASPNEEYMQYISAEGEDWPCYARAALGTQTTSYPNLNSFQVYSWGKDMMPGRSYVEASGRRADLMYPGWTAGSGTLPNADNGGWDLDGVASTEWVPGDGNLCNWEE